MVQSSLSDRDPTLSLSSADIRLVRIHLTLCIPYFSPSLQAAVDIMEKEGASLVDRPRNISAGEILSGGMRVLLTRYGDRFRKMRRYAPLLVFE
jgi:hypothetical protein